MVAIENVFLEKGILYIDAIIPDSEEYSRLYIKKVSIDNQDTYFVEGPSSNPIYQKEYDFLPSYIEGVQMSKVDPKVLHKYNTRKVSLQLKASDFSNISIPMESNIFFVYIIIGGTPNSTDCGKDKSTYLGVAYDCNRGLIEISKVIKGIDSPDAIPKALIDSILRYRAVDSSIKAGDYITAIKYWNKFFKDTSELEKTLNPCNCNGSTQIPL